MNSLAGEDVLGGQRREENETKSKIRQLLKKIEESEDVMKKFQGLF